MCAGISNAQALTDDLCNFEVDGVSLNTGKAGLDAKFGALGWHADSESAVNVRTRKTEEKYTYTRLSPEVIPVDGFRPGEREPRHDSSFTLRIIDGQPAHMSYGHQFPSEQQLSLDGLAGSLERAQAFCALSDSRFVLAGCDRIARGANIIALTMLPGNTAGSYCRIDFNAREGYSFEYTVNRIAENQSRVLQDRQSRLSR